MNNNRIQILLFCVFTCFSALCKGNTSINNLKVEYTETPLGLDVETPRFSWQMQSSQRGNFQSAYRIVVTDENQQKVWDTGKVGNNLSLNIEYQGATLQACTRYDWQVTVWDRNKKMYTSSSWFETGIMNPDPALTGWNGAIWIGGGDEDMVLYSHYLPVFKLSYVVHLDESSKTTRAAFLYGADDERLMDKNKNLFNLENKPGSSYLAVELDILPLDSGNLSLLHVYRVGYHPQDQKDVPLASFTIPEEYINRANKYAPHRFYLSSVLGYTQIYWDEEKPENLLARLNLNPLGQGGDFIAFPVLGNVGFSIPEGQSASFSQVEIRNFRSPFNLLSQEPLNDKFSCQQSTANLQLFNPSGNSMPMLRTTFSTKGKQVAKARLYATSRGIYDMYLNGKRVGADYFNPGLTQYPKTHLYQTFDVTDHLLPGTNALGAVLGEGWWSGGSTFMGDFWNFFGDRQSLLAKLVITYTNGEKDIVVSSPDSWSYFNNGPVVYSSFFQGEVYDASKEALVEGWSTASYDDSHWKKAVAVSLDGHICLDERNPDFNMPMVDDYSMTSLIGQFGETIKEIKEMEAIAVEEVRPGVFVYDMGQNLAGVPEIMLTGLTPGQQLTLRFAEVKYPDLPEYQSHAGMIMLENIRAAMAQDIYVAKGGYETIQPRFTLHGYRFVEITGISEPLPLSAVRTKVLSSIHELSSGYETSSPKVNKLWENITWSAYSNFISIPTDCPQRNERLGWSGDISVFSRTATYLFNSAQFLRKHMLAMRDVQREDGRFPDVAPLGGGFGGILWGSAGITVAWESYQQHQDKKVLVEQYSAMKKYICYLQQQIDPTTHILGNQYRNNWGSLGDWLSPEHDRNDKSLLWEAYFIYDLELVHRIAVILGEKEDAATFRQLYVERKEFFNKMYIDPQTGRTIFPDGDRREVDTQASYTLPLAFNIVSEQHKEKFVKNFVHTIQRENIADNGMLCPPYSLMTGFIGTAWINKALSDCGYTDVAYRLLQQKDYPSWLYSVEQGATTVWERLNSYTHKDGFGGNNQMNSFNHYSFGAVCSWMYNYSLGIERDESVPGFKHFLLKPEPDPTGGLTYAKGYYDSMYGRITSSWRVEEDICIYEFIIPANTTATLYLRAESLDGIREGKRILAKAKGVKYVETHGDQHLFELSSGNYRILVKPSFTHY